MALRARFSVALAFHFGIRPWEHDRLTIDEFYGFCDACDEIEKESKRSGNP